MVDYKGLITNLKSTSQLLDNLYYNDIFVINLSSNNIEYTSNKHNCTFLEKDFIGQSYTKLIEHFSKFATNRFKDIINAIIQLYTDSPVDIRNKLIFMTDIECHLVNHKYITCKFAPFGEDFHSTPILLACSIELSTCSYIDKIIALNSLTSDKFIYNIKNKKWTIENNAEQLTDTEKSIIAMSAMGLTVPEIANKLNKAPDTIKSAKKRIFLKLKVYNITQATIYAINNNLL